MIPRESFHPTKLFLSKFESFDILRHDFSHFILHNTVTLQPPVDEIAFVRVQAAKAHLSLAVKLVVVEPPRVHVSVLVREGALAVPEDSCPIVLLHTLHCSPLFYPFYALIRMEAWCHWLLSD